MGNGNVTYEMRLRDVNVVSGLNSADSAANRFEGSLSRVNGMLGAIGVTLGTAAIGMFGKSMIDAGSKVENAITGLTTLLKDAGEANRVVTQTMEDATKTPFGFEGLLQANKALISASVNADTARQDVLNLANAIAATGGGDDELQRMVVNLQQIKNTGEATALDVKQFAYAGVNLTKVLKDAGITGKLTYENITKALRVAHEEGGVYYNGLENMAGNTSVQISNLGDAMFQLKVKMFNDLKPAITTGIKYMGEFVGWLRKAWDWLYKNKDEIISWGKAIGTAVVAFKTMSVLPGILLSVENAFVAAATAGTGFGAALTAALSPAALIAGSLGAIVLYMDKIQQYERNKTKYLSDVATDEEDFVKQGEEKYKGMKDARQRAIADEEKDLADRRKRVDAEIKKLLPNGGDPVTLMRNTKLWDEYSFWNKEIEKIDARERGLSELKSRGMVPAAKGKKTPGPEAITPPDGKRLAAKASAAKVVTFNITIKDLIGTYNSNVTNIKAMTSELRQAVVNALTSAVNDFQITADR